jgi:hypothetical protein
MAIERPYARLWTDLHKDEAIAGLSANAFRLWVMALPYCVRNSTGGVINVLKPGTVALWSHVPAGDVPSALAELTQAGFLVAVADTTRDKDGQPTQLAIKNFARYQHADVYLDDAEAVPVPAAVVSRKDVTQLLRATLDAAPTAVPDYAGALAVTVPNLLAAHGTVRGVTANTLEEVVVFHAADAILGRLDSSTTQARSRWQRLRGLRAKHGSAGLIDALFAVSTSRTPSLDAAQVVLRDIDAMAPHTDPALRDIVDSLVGSDSVLDGYLADTPDDPTAAYVRALSDAEAMTVEFADLYPDLRKAVVKALIARFARETHQLRADQAYGLVKQAGAIGVELGPRCVLAALSRTSTARITGDPTAYVNKVAQSIAIEYRQAAQEITA